MKVIEGTQTAIGCGRPKPIFLYWPGLYRHLEIATSADDRCGDPFTLGGLGSPSFLLCENCGVKHGLIW